MSEPAQANRLSPAAGRVLCRLVRGVPGVAKDDALAELERLGLIRRVAPGECRDASQWDTLTREAEGLRAGLLKMRPPSGLAALVPGAAAGFRKRASAAQARMDALAEESREIERGYAAARRADWPLLPTAAPLPDGGRALITSGGYRAACAFWGGAEAPPPPEERMRSLEQAAGAAAELVRELSGWWSVPPEDAWLSCAILAGGNPRKVADAVRTLYEWLARGKFWGQNPFPAAVTLAGASDPGAAARTAADLAERLRGHSFGVGAEVFTAACRLAARSSWVAPETRLHALEWLAGRWEEEGLVAQHLALPALAPLACLPRPPAEVGRALKPVRDALRGLHPHGASTTETVALLLAGSGFYHEVRQDGEALLSRGDPVAHRLADRCRRLHAPLMEMDGPSGAPGHRVDILAGAAALLPGTVESILDSVPAARLALGAAGAPGEACRVPAALALAMGCFGRPLGIDPGDIAVELLTAQEMAQAAWKGKGPGREVAPSLKGF